MSDASATGAGTNARHPDVAHAAEAGRSRRTARRITQALLREWKLPVPGAHADKELRGTVLIVGGDQETPGAVLLAATAALRAGAGKLTIATSERNAPHVAIAMPEARVVGLPCDARGGVADSAATILAMLTDEFDAVLVGPGMRASVALDSIVAWVAHRFPVAVIVLDAGALSALPGTGASSAAQGPRAPTRCIATPHAGEMAGLLDAAKEEVRADAGPIAAATAARWNAVVTLKGAVTHVASPNGQRWIHDRPNPGLAVSGSGDVLAGLVAGLAARGATAEQAAVWAVALHAFAGAQFARRFGPCGFLARELCDIMPAVMAGLAQRRKL